MNQEIERIISAIIYMKDAFWGAALAVLKFEVTSKYPTLATNGKFIYINPTFWSKIDKDERMFGFAHECLHNMLGHHTRRPAWCDHETWNKACDYVINRELIKAGWTMPKGGLLDSKYDNMTEVQIARDLLKQKEQNSKSQPQQQPSQCKGEGNQKGESQSKSEQPSESDSEASTDDDGEGEGSGKGQPSESDSTGSGEPTEATTTYDGDYGQVLDAPADEAEEIAQTWKDVANNAVSFGNKLCGAGAGNLMQALGEANKPKADNRTLLRNFVNRITREDYSYRKPHKGYLSAGIVMPTLRNQVLGDLVIVRDTSGSVSDEGIKQFNAEIKDITSELGATAWVIDCDSHVHDAVECNASQPYPEQVKGRGGTNFAPAFKKIQDMVDNGLNISAVIYCTDGYTSDSDLRACIEVAPTLWYIIENSHFKAPFGETISLD